MRPYTPPAYESTAFNCPHCGAYADQFWGRFIEVRGNQNLGEQHMEKSTCRHCSESCYWFSGTLVYPPSEGPSPNPDLDPEIIEDYNEARRIVDDSPRGAAALLRLCIQKLMVQLGEKGKSINDDVASLVEKGLSVKIQQALDVVRVIGNNAVHPGELDIRDDLDTAMSLFGLVNQIAESMISEPKRIEELYAQLPESQREAIENRDKKSGATRKGKKK